MQKSRDNAVEAAVRGVVPADSVRVRERHRGIAVVDRRSVPQVVAVLNPLRMAHTTIRRSFRRKKDVLETEQLVHRRGGDVGPSAGRSRQQRSSEDDYGKRNCSVHRLVTFRMTHTAYGGDRLLVEGANLKFSRPRLLDVPFRASRPSTFHCRRARQTKYRTSDPYCD